MVSAAGAVGSYLPSNITDIWEPQRHFAYCKIPPQQSSAATSGLTTNTSSGIIASAGGSLTGVAKGERINICSFSPGDRALVSVLTSEGTFYLYSIGEEGGECSLLKTDSIMNDNEDDLE